MSKKIFVSYKYHDENVKPLFGSHKSNTRDYVDYIEDYVIGENIYKGEHDNEDLSDKSDEYIWDKLKDKIYDSSITIVLITPNMKEYNRYEKSQWIPWEISYSLRETPRSDRTSHSNAVIAVIIPNKSGSYEYYNTISLFRIIKHNIDNGYIPVFRWDYFKANLETCISKGENCKKNTPNYRIVKNV